MLSTIGLSNGGSKYRQKCVKINIEGLSSLKKLHLDANSAEISFSIRNLNSLELLGLVIGCTIDQKIITKILDQVQHIKILFLCGRFSYFNLDSLVNLKSLSLVGTIKESFNIDLLKNICNQLEVLKIIANKIIDEKIFCKLLDGHTFPNLVSFTLSNCNLKIFKKEFIHRFSNLIKLYIVECNIEAIEQDAFSNLKHLYLLDLSSNRLKFIEKDTFSNLMNLEILDLSLNELINLDSEFIGVRNSAKIFLENKNNETFKLNWITDID